MYVDKNTFDEEELEGYEGFTMLSKENNEIYFLIEKLEIFDLFKNHPIKKIKDLCRMHKINLIVITTPMCKNTVNRNYFKELKKRYPEIHNFEDVVTDDKYFSSCGHMNISGATIFTNQIIASLKDSKNL
jgi:hypothetical protein